MPPMNTHPGSGSHTTNSSNPTLHSGPAHPATISTYSGPSPSSAETCQVSEPTLQRSSARPSSSAAEAAGARYLQRRQTTDISTSIARSSGPPSASARERAARRFAENDNQAGKSADTRPSSSTTSTRPSGPSRVATAPQIPPLTLGGVYSLAKELGWLGSSEKIPAPSKKKVSGVRARTPSPTLPAAPPPSRRASHSRN